MATAMTQILQNTDVIAVIPARGGSKGIPHKNIIDLVDKPLIAYSIETATKAQLVDRVVVSTDDNEIAKVARQWGAEVPFRRPKEFAGDTVSASKAVDHLIKELYPTKERELIVVVLYPTHPFRTPNLIDHMVSVVAKNECDYAFTAKRVEIGNDTHFEQDNDGFLNPLDCGHLGRDSRRSLFRPYGVASVYRKGAFRQFYFHPLKHKASLVDIDTPQDLEFARAIIKNNLFDFNAGADAC